MLDVTKLPARFDRNAGMGPMYFASSELLTFASYLPELAASLPSAEVLRANIVAMFDRMSQRAREAGASAEDVREAQYPLAAFIDEQILRAPWNGRYEWQQRPLQLQWFGENTAGDNFFERMTALSRQASRAHVVEVYVMCLAHGFQGKHIQDPQALAPIIEQASLSLTPALPPGDPLSPKGITPAPRTALGAEAPLVRLGLAFFAVALLIYVLLRIVLSMSASSAEKSMSPTPGPTASISTSSK